MKYATILADPPWEKTDAGNNAKPRNWSSTHHVHRPNGNNGPRRRLEHYQTLQTEDLLALPVSDLADERAHLWLWSMNSTMETAYTLVRAWGFKPLNVITWRKTGANGNPVFGLGLYVRNSSEQLIFATRGAPARKPEKAWLGSVLSAPRRAHSRKPEVSYDLIEHVSEGPYLELFARERRLGWHSWGNQVESDVEL